MRPVLDAVRAILKFKDSASIAEIATMSGLPKRQVLDVLNRNGSMVWRDRKSGKVTRVDPISVLRGKLCGAGAYYWTSKGNYGSVDTLEFNGHEELKKRIQEEQWWGGFGDSSRATCVVDTPENRAALVAEGCVSEADLKPPLDERLWTEEAE